jgi:hypothetical protein
MATCRVILNEANFRDLVRGAVVTVDAGIGGPWSLGSIGLPGAGGQPAPVLTLEIALADIGMLRIVGATLDAAEGYAARLTAPARQR